jgi:hypothetical protein
MRPVAKTRLAFHPFSSFGAFHGGAFALVVFKSFAFSPWLILMTLGALLIVRDLGIGYRLVPS